MSSHKVNGQFDSRVLYFDGTVETDYIVPVSQGDSDVGFYWWITEIQIDTYYVENCSVRPIISVGIEGSDYEDLVGAHLISAVEGHTERIKIDPPVPIIRTDNPANFPLLVHAKVVRGATADNFKFVVGVVGDGYSLSSQQ